MFISSLSPFMVYFWTEMVPNDVQGELKHLYAAAGELLRHFWSCFPVNTPFLEEKVTSVQCTDMICDILSSVLTFSVILPPWTLRVSLLWQNCNTHVAVKLHYCSLTARPTEGAVAPFRMETVPFKVKGF